MIPYVVYSHTDYLDILKIQTEYLKNIENKILLINKTNFNIDEIYSNYDRIIFYDDSLPYAGRLTSLSELKLDYIFFTHDIDILINCDNVVIEKLFQIAKEKKIDRIDLQYYTHGDSSDNISVSCNGYDFYLNKQTNPSHYIYNVNPSIWKLSSFMEIMNTFKNEGYRTIEGDIVQNFCTKYDVYKLYGSDFLEIGYFHCLPFYQFLHITHGGGLLPLENNGLNEKINDEYRIICEKYLFKGNRNFKLSRW